MIAIPATMTPSRSPVVTTDQALALAFLRELAIPTLGCVELRVFRARYERGFVVPSNYASTFAGWYDYEHLHDLTCDAGRLRGISGYVTVNPVTPDLLSRSSNKLVQVKHASSDADILCLRWLYVDIDPVRPADISSTDAELAAAVARRDALLGDFPEVAARGMWGRSGNGAWILARLGDLPNDARGREFVAGALGGLARRYSDDAVTIDVKTKNPGRVCVLPGFFKCKGSDRPERPWRVATVDGGLPR